MKEHRESSDFLFDFVGAQKNIKTSSDGHIIEANVLKLDAPCLCANITPASTSTDITMQTAPSPTISSSTIFVDVEDEVGQESILLEYLLI